jgi:phosphatidylserine/phosphatidylglycerophosphate/cardiolipin synthase-like enzyme
MTGPAAFKFTVRTPGHSHLRRLGLLAAVTALGLMMTSNEKIGAQTGYPAEWLCDNQYQDCRTPILRLIDQETEAIDVSYWFMIDSRYKDRLIAAKNRGVKIRVIVDTQADGYAVNKTLRENMIAAGIPFRDKTTQGINHWKMMLYAGQNKVHFTAANFAQGSYSPTTKYTNYVDEAIYFTNDPAIVHTFMTKYDDLWTDTVNFTNLANISGPLTRSYPTYPMDSRLNFPPDQDYQDRVVSAMRTETEAIDVIIFRVTSGKIPDELLRRHQAGIPIRIITDKDQYRNTTYFWHSYNIDRLYAAGLANPGSIQIKWRRDDASSDEDMHQKSLVLHSRDMAIFGSSNWTSSSSDTQREHNIFMPGSGTLGKAWFVDWFKDQFERRWNNRKALDESPRALPAGVGAPLDVAMYLDFVPAYPEAPVISSPANGALGVTSPVLRWEGGWWAHKYDIYFGTTNPPPLIAQNFMPTSSSAGVSSTKESFNPCAPPAPFESACPAGLAAGTTYYWRIRSKTMVGDSRAVNGGTWSFSTGGAGAVVPPAPTGLTGTAVSSSRIDLSWNNVANEEGYKIERKLSSASTWTQVATRPADVTTYQDQSGIAAGATYNYRVRAYSSAGNSGYSNTITVTSGQLTLSPTDVVLYASKAPVRVGAWSPVADSTAAGGNRMNNPNAGAAMVSTPLANPANYFEMTFTAPAGQGFRLWIRGKAASNNGNNDSAHVQFSDSVTSGGSAVYRIGTTSGTYVNLAEVSGAALQDWGWQDNGFGAGVFGPLIYFANGGTHTIRVQVREDGFSIDQIVLSRDTFLNASPGANKADNTKLSEQNGGSGSTTPPPAPEGLRIIADGYVRGGSFASTKFGTATELITKKSADLGYAREAYMLLDISDVQSSSIVTLKLSGYLSDTRASSVTANVFAVSDTSWTEGNLTWNLPKPAAGSLLDSVSVSGTARKTYNVDLTSYARARRSAGATRIAIAIVNPTETLPYSAFSSRESAAKPLLLIE